MTSDAFPGEDWRNGFAEVIKIGGGNGWLWFNPGFGLFQEERFRSTRGSDFVQRHRCADWLRSQRPASICAHQENCDNQSTHWVGLPSEF